MRLVLDPTTVRAKNGLTRVKIAELAEVLRFQTARRIPARNRYPNAAMHARDEKTQVNEFLAESLAHCLREGFRPVALEGRYCVVFESDWLQEGRNP